MKRKIAAFILVINGFFAYAQSGGSIDLILLLDTSSSMSGSYQRVSDYISGGFLREFLRIGDTFHLIPFSDKPRVDIARRIEGRGDVETIIGRMLLQYPLDPWTDIPAALSFAENYALSLPARPKKIILISDGDTALPPGSASPAPDAAGLTALIGGLKTRLGSRNIGLEFVKVTPGQALANLPSSGRAPAPGRQTPPPARPSGGTGQSAAQGRQPAQTPALPAQTAQTGSAARPAAPPAQAAQSSGQSGSAAQAVPPPAQATQSPGQSGSAAPPASPPAQPAQTPGQSGSAAPPAPAAQSPGQTGSAARPVSPPAQTAQSSAPPSPAAPAPEASRFFEELPLPLPLIIALAVLALLALGFIIFLVSRRLQGSPNRAIAMAAAPRSGGAEEPAPFTDHSKDLANYAASQSRQRTTPYTGRTTVTPEVSPVIDPNGPLLLNLFVEDQNTFIGKRNIHALKSGYNFTIGGGKSDFLIFLVPMPPAIGEIRRSGGQCTFIPRKPKYFPDIGSAEVPDCIGKTIRVVSDKNYELRFRLERYEDPLIALNRLLNSVKVPG
jgi:hypothetical protein